MDYLTFAEDLEDIAFNLGENAILNSFKDKDNIGYITFGEYDFLIRDFEGIEDEDNDVLYFSCEVVQYGFLIENPLITKFYKNKKFNKQELISFILNFSKKIDNLKEIMVIDDFEFFFKNFNKKNFLVKGINFLYWTNFIEENNRYGKTNVKKILKKEIIYISNGKENYRLEFFTTYGLDCDGIESTSWGNLNIQKIENNDFPKDFNFVSWGNDYRLYLSHFNKNHLVFSLTSKENDFELDEFAFYNKDSGSIKKLGGDAGLNFSEDDLKFYFFKGKKEILLKEIIIK